MCYFLIIKIALPNGAPNGPALTGSVVIFLAYKAHCLLTQGASVRQYISAGIPMIESFVHFFISLSPLPSAISVLFPYPSPSSSPFLSSSISQQTKMIHKREA
jgi:hypothetical protein